MKDAAVAVDNFSLELGGAQILKKISFSVRPGDYISIVGPNGAGKTTLLKCLNRVLTGGSGSVRIFGSPLEELSQRELARRVSYVPQLDGRSLPLAAGKGYPPLADNSIQLFRKFLQVLYQAREAGRLVNSFRAGCRSAVGDVLSQALGK